MTRDPLKGQDRIDAFADVVRQVQPSLPARQRAAGWQRLEQALASRRSLPDEGRAGRVPARSLRLGLALAFAAILIPVAWRIVKRPRAQPLQYVVTGGGGAATNGTAGEVLSAQEGPVQLVFTDGSRVSMRAAAHLTVASLRARGSDVQLVDGTIDVDVRHQRDTSWRFVAGPYAIYVKGTSFALGWDATQKRFELRMRTGVVALTGPGGGRPLTVAGGESLLLDGSGNPLGAAAPPPPPVGATTSTLRSASTRKDRERQLGRPALAHGEWGPLLARGNFDVIVEQANKAGIDACLAADTEPNLAALADAARYTHRSDLARRSLLALRARFPSSDRARDAAFFLARLSETTSPGSRQALSWYERYLRETTSGSYAEQALGREMILLRRNDGDGGARTRSVARRYLAAYPRGIYAGDAAGLLETTPAP